MIAIKLLRDALLGDKVQKQYEKVENCIRAKAQLVSDQEFHRTMANFYTERVLSIDPNKKWWEFAHAKQKQKDHQDDFLRYEQKVIEAQAKLDAQKVAFEALQKELYE